MKYIPYTEETKMNDWIKEVNTKKRKRKNFSSKIHKNLKSK